MQRRASQWVAMAMAMFLLASVTIGTSARAEEQLGRGKRWVRSHPFTTMALTIVPATFDADH